MRRVVNLKWVLSLEPLVVFINERNLSTSQFLMSANALHCQDMLYSLVVKKCKISSDCFEHEAKIDIFRPKFLKYGSFEPQDLRICELIEKMLKNIQTYKKLWFSENAVFNLSDLVSKQKQ